MRRTISLALLLSFLIPVGARASADEPAQWVDPMIGSVPAGFTSPGPVMPHGMVGLGPDTEGPLNYGGYYWHNSLITGFSHIHMSAGVPRGGQIPFMPIVGPVTPGDVSDLAWTQPVPAYSSPAADHSEVAQAGYYAVRLERYGIDVELTATTRAGVHRYTFPPATDARVILDVGRDISGRYPMTFTPVDGSTVTGAIHATGGPRHWIFFAARFSEPITSMTTLDGETVTEPIAHDGAGVVLDFGALDAPLLSKVGISYVDEVGALANLDAEVPGWDFDVVRRDAWAAWNDALDVIEVEGGTDAEKTSFYTALYHTQLFPNLASDVDMRYLAADDVIRTADRPRYTGFSLWDSYRGQNQLLAVISPDRYRDMIASLLDFSQRSGWLPRWQLAHRDQGSMSGDPVIPFIGEGWCRGLVPDDMKDDVFAAMRALADRREQAYLDRGYKPTRPPGNQFELLEGGPRDAGTTLEFGLAEFALALMADEDGRTGDRDVMLQRAEGFRQLLDPETKWIRPRDANGNWLEPFAPELGYGFQEGTSWQYSWLAMQDLRGLFDLMGGDDVVRDRLDTFFSFAASAAAPVAMPKVQNQATVFGIVYYGNQYAPGNEHDLQTPFLYNYAGAPWKTQAMARSAASLFTPTNDGLPGNDDLGALSGWLVWTMLGIYPMTPGAPMYTVASPVFTHATIHAPGGDIAIDASEASPVARFVVDATLNGEQLTRPWLLHEDLADGGTLELTMSAIPDTSWGAAPGDAPPSISTHAPSAFGCR